MKGDKRTSLYRYRFGTAEFDEARFELTVAGLSVELQHRPLEMLLLLLRHTDEVVTRDELVDALWQQRVTSDQAIANAMAKLRSALGEENAQRIVTQSKVGYRFKGPVERVAVGRAFTSSLDLRTGCPAPRRENFMLISQLGEGSGSEVWLAKHKKTGEQRVYKFSSDAQRLTALKREATLYRVLRDSLGERPDFVRVIDWNFEAPPFFLECEYGGPNLLQWAADGNALAALSSDERVDLFLQIADAVAAAHSVAVLHTDLKPANVLVAAKPAGWRVRVGDFGSGLLLERDRLEALGITQLGLNMTQAVGADSDSGTPLYLAPEVIAGEKPNAGSDVYALGLILYQLLHGDLRKPLVSGWKRDIADEVLREAIEEATDGDPRKRLPTVVTLVERLRNREQRRVERRHQARIEESLHRSRARRPWVIAALASLGLGLAATSWLYYRELWTHRQLQASEAQARREATRAEEVTRFLNDNVLSSADPFGKSSQQRTIKQALDDAAGSLEGRFPNDPVTEASIRMALGTVYIRIMEGAEAELQWRRVVALLTTALGSDDSRLIESRYWLAQALTLQSKFGEAEATLRAADQGRLLIRTENQRLDLAAHRSWGIFFLNRQECPQAIPHLEKAAQLLQLSAPVDFSSFDLIRINLGQCYASQSRFKDSEGVATNLLMELRQRNKPSELTKALANYLYGLALLYQRRYQDAEPALDAAYGVMLDKLGAANPRTNVAHNFLCNLYSFTGRREKALDCLNQIYAAQRNRSGESHWMTAVALASVGSAQYALDQYSDASRSLETAHADLMRSLGPDNSLTLMAAYYLARTLLKLGDVDRATQLAQNLDAKRLDAADPGAPWQERLSLLNGLILLSQHRRADALPLLRVADALPADEDPGDTIIADAQNALHSSTVTSTR